MTLSQLERVSHIVYLMALAFMLGVMMSAQSIHQQHSAVDVPKQRAGGMHENHRTATTGT